MSSSGFRWRSNLTAVCPTRRKTEAVEARRVERASIRIPKWKLVDIPQRHGDTASGAPVLTERTTASIARALRAAYCLSSTSAWWVAP